jgi:hypothetical protein
MGFLKGNTTKPAVSSLEALSEAMFLGIKQTELSVLENIETNKLK